MASLLLTCCTKEGKGSTFYIDYYGAMYMSGCMVHYVEDELVTLLLANPYTQSVVDAGEGFEAGFSDTPVLNPPNPVMLHKLYLSNEPGDGFTIADSTATRICGGAMQAFYRGSQTQISYFKYIGIDCNMNAALLLLAMFIISKYELTDEVIDDINKKIEARNLEK